MSNIIFTVFSIGFFVYVALKCYVVFQNHQNEQPEQQQESPPAAPTIKSRPPELIVRNIGNCFKLKYCETLKKPTMIGLEEGKTKHFRWQPDDESSASFTECSTCKFEDDEDHPPSYNSMFP